MGLRVRLGGGWSIGSSGLRYGKRIGGVYVNTGKSGTLISKGRLRYWAPNRSSGGRRGAGARSSGGQCDGITNAASRCQNRASVTITRVSDGLVIGHTCKVHANADNQARLLQEQADREAAVQAEADRKRAAQAAELARVETARQEAIRPKFTAAGTAHTEEEMRHKVDALLATAASHEQAGNSDAASSYLAKAQELETRHWVAPTPEPAPPGRGGRNRRRAWVVAGAALAGVVTVAVAAGHRDQTALTAASTAVTAPAVTTTAPVVTTQAPVVTTQAPAPTTTTRPAPTTTTTAAPSPTGYGWCTFTLRYVYTDSALNNTTRYTITSDREFCKPDPPGVTSDGTGRYSETAVFSMTEPKGTAASGTTSNAPPTQTTLPAGGTGGGTSATTSPAGTARTCWVNGYTRKDGTYVHGYYRSC